MAILFSCITRGTVILCSHQADTGNFHTTVQHMLPNIPTRDDGKTTYTSNNYCFHCIIDNGLIYMCATETKSGKQQPYLYLEEIRSQFKNKHLTGLAMTAGSDELNSDFKQVFSEQMKRFSDGGVDSISQLRSQVDDVKDVMTQNIEKVLQRGEGLDDLMDKTEELEASAIAFQKTSRKIHKKFWWQNTKMTLILIGVSVLVISIIIIIILASTGVFKPSSGSDTNPTSTPTPSV